MTLYGWLIFPLWLTLVAYWGLSAPALKRAAGVRWIWWREIAVRLGFFALLVLALQIAVAGHALPAAGRYEFNTSTLAGLIGFALAALGIALAIRARAYLNRSCATTTQTHDKAELVTSGPYAWVRHPIYSGTLLAMLGSAIGQSALWLLPLIVYGPHFIRSARSEEIYLSEQFPGRYRAYMQRTKMLLPFVL